MARCGPGAALVGWCGPGGLVAGFLGAATPAAPLGELLPQKPPTIRHDGQFFFCPLWRGVALTRWAPIGYRQQKNRKMPPTSKRTAHARKNHTAAILSRKPLTVTRRTLTPENPSHSLKTAKTPFRCPHTWQRLRRLSAPLRCLSAPINAAYRSGNFWQDGRPYHGTVEIRQNVTKRNNPPPIDSPVFRWTIRGMRIADQIRDADPSGGNHQDGLTDKGC